MSEPHLAPDPAGIPRRVGTAADFDWIREHLELDATIQSAIPAIYDAYATVIIQGDQRTVGREHGTTADRPDDAALLAILTGHAEDRPWWLGYLDTGPDEPIISTTPLVTSNGWRYVLIEAGPAEAWNWRGNHWRHWRTLPDLIFPADRSWLVNTLWDDDWRCIGGPQHLIDAILTDPDLDARQVRPGEDMTPPGHTPM
jgi:hypothetical protein